MIIEWPSKDPAESLICSWDFGPELDVGEAISSALVSVSLLSGADANPGAMLFSPKTIVSNVVFQPFRGGLDGATYRLRCEATISPTGRVLVLAATLPVRAA